ncbi:MAG: ribosome maturation factor RimP [Thermodesulfovibrio sp.]|nr:ribosome maturation factor RimP [Thermodesulfovibrio sp.]
MNLNELKELITNFANEIAQQESVEVVGVDIYPGRKGLTLRIFIDKEGGVTIRDCESFSRSLEAILDVEDPIKNSYTLEVSSPGIDRPLKQRKDFLRNIGKDVKITTKQKIANKTFFIGKIIDVGEDWVRIETYKDKKKKKGELLFIPFDKILKAQIYIG